MYMVERTGTLWENKLPSASCVHGFISFMATFIDRHDPTIREPRFRELAAEINL